MTEQDDFEPSVVNAIFLHLGIAEPWAPLPTTGIANRVYGTSSLVLRIATDHPDGISDARTESVAAPVAHAAGIRTPALLAFDDSRQLVDRPFTLWERVPGQPLGSYAPDAESPLGAWEEIGREVARLHLAVTECPDPKGWLDETGYGDPREHFASLAGSGALAVVESRRLEAWLLRLEPLVKSRPRDRFLHGDLHDMNVMCDDTGVFVALLDWGDAGWGDPAIEFTKVPLSALATTVAAYQDIGPGLLGENGIARVIWERLASILWRISAGRVSAERVVEFLSHGERARPPWRDLWA